jgi:hypothetical protein
MDFQELLYFAPPLGKSLGKIADSRPLSEFVERDKLAIDKLQRAIDVGSELGVYG